LRFELLKILLVDDNPHMRAMVTEILRAVGVRHITQANDGSEALSVMRHESVDIIIADLAMSPVDGIDFVRLLRNAPDSPNHLCPVIMMSGHSTERRVGEARDAGINTFIAKPITARGVLERIAEVVDHPRPYARSSDFFGPDRRRRNDPNYTGPRRRVRDDVATRDIDDA
jgi:two-component system chemotaxis response regulator CheY